PTACYNKYEVTPFSHVANVLLFEHPVPNIMAACFLLRSVANDRYSLWKLGITHVVNAAHGRTYCQGSRDFYGATVEYYGVPADDSPSFDLSRYFLPTAEYIHNSLNANGVLVHCAVGVSRSASLVLAYLMIYHSYTLLAAINKVKECRWIFPNRGFLKQLHSKMLCPT
uniref:Dual specificity protein phosphatase n=1 Tax=Xiphophorus couchianus TaxID=32473 RepID=A0A3B5LDS8_9TELE